MRGFSGVRREKRLAQRQSLRAVARAQERLTSKFKAFHSADDAWFLSGLWKAQPLSLLNHSTHIRKHSYANDFSTKQREILKEGLKEGQNVSFSQGAGRSLSTGLVSRRVLCMCGPLRRGRI